MDEKQELKFHQLTEEPVGKLICHLALPCILSMLVTAFYNMADTFFVGMLDSNAATGAVGVVFSMMAVIQAVGFFFGHGSGNFISRELGKHHTDEASNMASTGFFLALFTGAAICVLGQIFLTPLAVFLGSSSTILPYAKAYLGVILLGAPWMTASLVLNNQLRFQGNAVYGTVGIVSGAVLNIGLDPLLMFVFDLGVAGAAWATIISQFASFCLLLFGCARGGNIPIRISRFRPRWFYVKHIIQGGLPSLARQSLASVATICINHAAMPYGDAAIAAMGVVQRIMNFGGSAMIGFGQGFQPVCGFNYGARLYGRVKEGFWFCVRGAVAFFFQGWITMSNMMLQTIGRTVPATLISAARQGLFLIPLVWLLTASPLGLLGLQMAQSVSDALTLALAVPIQLHVLRHLAPPEHASLS